MNAQRLERQRTQYQTLTEELARARITSPDWAFGFDELANLHIAGSADVAYVAHLISTSPSPFLAGLLTGLWLNN